METAACLVYSLLLTTASFISVKRVIVPKSCCCLVAIDQQTFIYRISTTFFISQLMMIKRFCLGMVLN